MNRGMETVEMFRKLKRLKKASLMVNNTSRSRYYEHMDADDIKVMVLKKYVNLMGCDLIVRDRVTQIEKII